MEPSLADGITYWEKQEATIDGVLGMCLIGQDIKAPP